MDLGASLLRAWCNRIYSDRLETEDFSRSHCFSEIAQCRLSKSVPVNDRVHAFCRTEA